MPGESQFRESQTAQTVPCDSVGGVDIGKPIKTLNPTWESKTYRLGVLPSNSGVITYYFVGFGVTGKPDCAGSRAVEVQGSASFCCKLLASTALGFRV